MRYDYLVVGAGLFGATFAHEAREAGRSVLVVERRPHIAGNVYTEEVEGIQVHRYGAHIFHTNNAQVWAFVNRFATFNRYTNSPIAVYKGEVYNLPFNMNTFYQMWGTSTPEEARREIDRQVKEAGIVSPRNLEEHALASVGRDIYEKLVKGYTAKQWGKPCDELPAFLIKRLPVRFTYDNNYFNDRFQGIPIGGYTQIAERLLEGVEVRLGVDYTQHRDELRGLAGKVIYTGMIDQYFGNRFGPLEYRSLKFETTVLDVENYQGNAVVNYTEADVPYTRIIEHKHFDPGSHTGDAARPKTVVTKEYPASWQSGVEAYYPMNNERNDALFLKYHELVRQEEGIVFGGRLGSYKYLNMDQTMEEALALAEKELAGA